jgi:hypothetical protein
LRKCKIYSFCTFVDYGHGENSSKMLAWRDPDCGMKHAAAWNRFEGIVAG